MGIVYYLVDKPNRRSYDLNKGVWNRVFGNGRPMPSTPAELRDRVSDVWANSGAAKRDWSEYIDRMTCEIWGFIRSAGPENVEMRNDASDDDEPYPIVGSRCVDVELNHDPLGDTARRYREEARLALCGEPDDGHE